MRWDDCNSPLILCECEDGKVPTTYIYQTTSVKCKIYSNKKGSTREPFVEIWDKEKKEWVEKNSRLV